jgi:hypothetical protein
MLDQVNATPTPHKPVALEQGQTDRSKAAAAAQTRLVDPDKAPDRRPSSRPSRKKHQVVTLVDEEQHDRILSEPKTRSR